MRDLTGRVFGRWVVVGLAYRTTKAAYWQCRCECGNVKDVRDTTLLNGESSSCGWGKCHHAYRHGASGYTITKAYRSWRHMVQRCTNPNKPEYHRYGGRGVKVCDRWKSFPEFLEDMGNPAEGMTLDRIDSNGDYEPSNCRWATRKQQGANTCRVINITYNGETRNIREWAAHLGMKYRTLTQRLNTYHWPIDKAFNAPITKGGGRVRSPKGSTIQR